MARERSERLWRALGFADVDDEEVRFTDADVEALQAARTMDPVGLVDARAGPRPGGAPPRPSAPR